MIEWILVCTMTMNSADKVAVDLCESSYISWSTCKADAFRLMTHHEIGLANCHGRDQFTGKAIGVFDDDFAICPSRI